MSKETQNQRELTKLAVIAAIRLSRGSSGRASFTDVTGSLTAEGVVKNTGSVADVSILCYHFGAPIHLLMVAQDWDRGLLAVVSDITRLACGVTDSGIAKCTYRVTPIDQ